MATVTRIEVQNTLVGRLSSLGGFNNQGGHSEEKNGEIVVIPGDRDAATCVDNNGESWLSGQQPFAIRLTG